MHTVLEKVNQMTQGAEDLLLKSQTLQESVQHLTTQIPQNVLDPWIVGLTVFVLACVVGYYVVWRVTPALHSPLMAVTNAISSVIIVGAILAVGPEGSQATLLGCFGVFLAAINIFGGFVVTQRMLDMFKSNKSNHKP